VIPTPLLVLDLQAAGDRVANAFQTHGFAWMYESVRALGQGAVCFRVGRGRLGTAGARVFGPLLKEPDPYLARLSVRSVHAALQAHRWPWRVHNSVSLSPPPQLHVTNLGGPSTTISSGFVKQGFAFLVPQRRRLCGKDLCYQEQYTELMVCVCMDQGPSLSTEG